MNSVDAITKKRDINRMKKALPEGRDRLLFTIGINSLLRISDLLQLKVSDVFNANGTPKDQLVVSETKTGKRRYITLNTSIKKELRKLDNRTDGDAFLFRSRKGGGSKAISRVQAYRILNAAADRAGITLQIGTHTLRKTGARHMYENGSPLALLMELLNHTSEAVTLRYIGVNKDDIRKAYVDLNL